MGVIPIVPGTGGSTEDVATDEIAGRHHQQVKQGFGEDGEVTPVSVINPQPVQEIGSAESVMLRLLQMLQSPRGFDAVLGRLRVQAAIDANQTIANITTVAAVTTVAALTSAANLVAIGGLDGSVLVRGQNLAAWQAVHRSRLVD